MPFDVNVMLPCLTTLVAGGALGTCGRADVAEVTVVALLTIARKSYFPKAETHAKLETAS